MRSCELQGDRETHLQLVPSTAMKVWHNEACTQDILVFEGEVASWSIEVHCGVGFLVYEQHSEPFSSDVLGKPHSSCYPSAWSAC